VRLPRERATWRARGFANLYPVGEGAGYAGGIMSAALDGANAAQALLRMGTGARAGYALGSSAEDQVPRSR
jgi:hypothetical protein